MTAKWYETGASEKYRRAYLKATDLVDVLGDETDVTLEDIQGWRDDEVYEWLEAWGFEWDDVQWIGAEEGGEQ